MSIQLINDNHQHNEFNQFTVKSDDPTHLGIFCDQLFKNHSIEPLDIFTNDDDQVVSITYMLDSEDHKIVSNQIKSNKG